MIRPSVQRVASRWRTARRHARTIAEVTAVLAAPVGLGTALVAALAAVHDLWSFDARVLVAPGLVAIAGSLAFVVAAAVAAQLTARTTDEAVREPLARATELEQRALRRHARLTRAAAVWFGAVYVLALVVTARQLTSLSAAAWSRSVWFAIPLGPLAWWIAGGLVGSVRWSLARPRARGVPLDLRAYPGFAALLDELAAPIVGKAAAITVSLTPEPLATIQLRGGLHLMLGVALLDGLDHRRLRALLAHELAHARADRVNEPRLAGRVTAAALGLSAPIALLTPAGWFARAWRRIERDGRLPGTRIEELIADRIAAIHAGADAMSDALEHVVARSVWFARRMSWRATPTLDNLYDARHAPPALYREAELTRALRDHEQTHPPLATRVARLRALAAPPPARADDGDPAWALLPDREQIERAMTSMARAWLR